MATLADLKTRIVAEMVRDDLEDDLAAQLLLHIQRACEFYAADRFWYNAIVATVSTSGGVDTVDVPATVRRVDRVTVPAQYAELQEAQIDDLERLTGTVTGLPWRYAYYNDQLKLYPVPDAAYVLQITGLKQIDAPADDGDTSAWTNEAQDLISARTRFTLYRDVFRDPDGATMAAGAVQEALQRLRRETARRLKTPLRAMVPQRGFNIYSG